MECKLTCADRISKGVNVKKNDKQRIVDELHTAWSESTVGIVAQYRGLTVSEMGTLRRQLREAGVSLQVVKNTLARRAATDTGFKAAEELFTGPVAIAYGSEPVGMAKAISDFAKAHKALEVRGGVLDGKLIDVQGITALASLPSREVLLAKMLGSMQSPISGFVRTLSEVPASFVRTLAAVRDQKEAA
ncbi:50S ribosomal protein L10 [Mariprofundus ferrooxydans]|nr:50S ribosomal protein L10 [Mariprofundus ferrooxydans]